jgi:uncharacterized membrane protein YfhO
MKQYLKNPKAWYLVGLFVADGVFFMGTNPNKVPSVVLIAGLLLLIATMYCVVRAVLMVAGLYIPILRRRQHRLGIFLTLTGAVLLALQSVEQLSVRDTLVIVPLAIVFYIYVTYVKTRPISKP